MIIDQQCVSEQTEEGKKVLVPYREEKNADLRDEVVLSNFFTPWHLVFCPMPVNFKSNDKNKAKAT